MYHIQINTWYFTEIYIAENVMIALGITSKFKVACKATNIIVNKILLIAIKRNTMLQKGAETVHLIKDQVLILLSLNDSVLRVNSL